MIRTSHTAGSLARVLLPEKLQAALRPPWKYYQCRRICSDARSVRTLWDAFAEQEDTCPEKVIRVRALSGGWVRFRANRTDSGTLLSTFYYKFHLPAPGLLDGTVQRVMDLGANIGATTLDLCNHYPSAQVIAVELDADNVRVLQGNTDRLRDRVAVVHGGIYCEDSSLTYRKRGVASDSFQLRPLSSAGDPAMVSVQARSLNTLFERFLGSHEVVDYMKMDIEGAERAVLTCNAEWSRRVRCLKVELHDEYQLCEARRDMTELGFKVVVDHVHWACLTGVR